MPFWGSDSRRHLMAAGGGQLPPLFGLGPILGRVACDPSGRVGRCSVGGSGMFIGHD